MMYFESGVHFEQNCAKKTVSNETLRSDQMKKTAGRLEDTYNSLHPLCMVDVTGMALIAVP